MKNDFDKRVDRRGTASLKWDVAEGELPMWVADMDFETAPEIRAALAERIEHGAFGYSIIPDSWYEAYINWWEKRHQFKMQKDWLIFTTGVVPAISSIVRKLTTVGENVLIQTPVYNIFFNSIINNGRNVLESPLVYDGVTYQIDFEQLKKDLSNPQTTMMILCNPHNPVGKIWDKETLERIGELCNRYHVVVVSDEIHCDLTDPGCEYIPFASVSEVCRQNSITCIAPTKTFNMAGLQSAAVVVPDENLRYKVWRGLNTDEVAEPNSFAVIAAVTAFTKGAPWLDALREYILENKQYVEEFLKQELPQIKLVPGNATYLLWLDCREVTENSEELAEEIRQKSGLYLSDGMQYGKGGAQFLRMNIACPKATVKDGLERLKRSL